MKRESNSIFFAVAASLLFSSIAHAQTLSSETPAVVELTHALDSKELMYGTIVQTRLTETVHLPNGTKLPKGTWLDATIAQDDMQINGKLKLVLRFTDARMKNGKTTPIKATILAVETRFVPVENLDGVTETFLPVPANLNNQSDSADFFGIAPGVDLHSRASSQNSGVFVTTTKDDIRLPIGTKMELALAPSMSP